MTISMLTYTVRPSVDRRLDDTAFGAGTLSWQGPVHFWKAGPGEVMTVKKKIMSSVVNFAGPCFKYHNISKYFELIVKHFMN